jgi:enamine deaminase RidA (YjgF/YER057c/UK114 family)
MARVNYSSGAKWEDIVGYSRAVRVGNLIEVSGTVASDENNQLVGGDSAYAQTVFVLEKIRSILDRAGATLADVVRTRIYVTDISQWEEIGNAHGEFFRDIKPCATMVEVNGLVSPEYLVEIEVSAVLQNDKL